MWETISSTNNLFFNTDLVSWKLHLKERIYNDEKAFVFLISIEITVEDERYLKKKEFMWDADSELDSINQR